MLEVTLFGSPRVECAGEPVAFDTRKAMALLAHLAVSGRARSRDALAELLWPSRDIEHARGALRRTLSSLRAAIGADRVESTRDRVRLVAGGGLRVDVHRFRALVADGELGAAAAAFHADFMEGFAVRDAPGFEHWQRAEAEALRRELSIVLARLAADREERGDVAVALRHARRWLDLDRLHEPAHRAVIRLSAVTGDRAGAMVGYRECVRTLSRELGVPPLRETTALYEAISRGDLDPTPTPAADPDPPPSRLALVGRDDELRRLVRAHRASAVHGRVAVLEGEAGIGKTRLAEEIIDRVRAAGGIALLGRAYLEESGLAYAPVIDALRTRLAGDPGWVDRLPAATRREVARLLPELRTPGSEASPALDGPGAAASFLAGVWEAVTLAVGGPVPGVLLIDDVQFADDSSLELLSYGLRRLADRPLLVLLTWRAAPEHALRGVVRDVATAGHGAAYRLERLTEADVALALRGAADAPGNVGEVHAQTEGLPFLLVEYLTALGTDPAAAWTLGAGARDLMRTRLDPVSETARQVLAAAAVLGRSFDVETVRTVSGRGDEETVDAVEELTQRGLVREGPRDYDFSHEQLRALVYDDTSLARRRLLHTRAALLPLPPAAVARHLLQAGRDVEAATAYVRASEHACALFAHAEAVEHLRAALALGHPEPSALHVALGEVQTQQGNYAGALASFETAAATGPSERLAYIEQRIGQVHHRRGDWALASSHFTAALSAVAADDLAARARITVDLSLTAEADGRPADAAELAGRARGLAEQTGDQRTVAQAENLLGLLATTSGRPADALTHLRASLALAESVGDPYARVAALNNLALAHRDSGQLDQAIALTRTAVDLGAALGDRHRAAALQNNLADLLHACGHGDEAMVHLKLAVSLFAQVGGEGAALPEVWKLVRW
ncbi:MAG: AAA family ATPase [Geodermatophilaceae bacterium]|nr:AAA family ATPase [Geodermatophilaceae bacterium]